MSAADVVARLQQTLPGRVDVSVAAEQIIPQPYDRLGALAQLS